MKTVKYLAVITAVALLAACSPKADVVSQSLSQAADNFDINRRIVFYNGITGQNMLVIEGRCSLGNHDSARELSVTCMTGPGEYKKHFLGLSDNVTYFAEQIDPAQASPYHYIVVFNPRTAIPDAQVR